MKRISLLFFWCMARTRHSNGFNNNVFSHNSQRTILSSKTSGPEEYDDGIGNPDSQAKDGEALAKDFYDQLRKREQDLKKTKGESSEGSQIESLSNQEFLSRIVEKDSYQSSNDQAPFSRRSSDEAPKVKFTGRQSSSPSLFSSSSGGSARSPREIMMEREYNLVDRAERNIAFQAVLAVAALAFYIFVGLSGGISSGDAVVDDFGADDEIPFEQLIPVQTDRETSVWL